MNETNPYKGDIVQDLDEALRGKKTLDGTVYTTSDTGRKYKRASVPDKRILTYSEIRKFLFCEFAWYWRYKKGIVPLKRSMAMKCGILFHDAMFELLTTKDLRVARERADAIVREAEDIKEKQEVAVILSASLSPIFTMKNFPALANFIDLELTVWHDLGDFIIAGKIDAIGKNSFIDYKYSAQAWKTAATAWMCSLQLGIYGFLTGMKGNILLVTPSALRLKQSETMEEYMARVSDDIMDSSKYQIINSKTMGAIDAKIKIKAAHDRIKFAIDNGSLLSNTDNCSMCEYRELCANLDSDAVITEKLKLFESSQPHGELGGRDKWVSSQSLQEILAQARLGS